MYVIFKFQFWDRTILVGTTALPRIFRTNITITVELKEIFITLVVTTLIVTSRGWGSAVKNPPQNLFYCPARSSKPRHPASKASDTTLPRMLSADILELVLKGKEECAAGDFLVSLTYFLQYLFIFSQGNNKIPWLFSNFTVFHDFWGSFSNSLTFPGFQDWV